jgi:hypothetical protein
VIIGGVLGPITRPDVVIAGLYRGNDLVIVGRTVPLHPRQAAELGKLLQPAKPGHPWPDEICWGPGARLLGPALLGWSGRCHRVICVDDRCRAQVWPSAPEPLFKGGGGEPEVG